MPTVFARPLTLALTLLGLGGPLLTSCGSSAPVQAQSTPASTEANLSGEGQATLRALRQASGTALTENGYLNRVAVTPVGTRNERSGGRTRWAHQWALSRWAQVGPDIVKVQWMRAYAVDGASTPGAVLSACQDDGPDALGCAQALRQATHAAAERQADGTWLVVLAALDRPLSVQPRT